MTGQGQKASSKDTWIQGSGGRLFVRVWSPEKSGLPGSTSPAPIFLLHDSLGCVALWRTFPEQLCAQTGRQVIAYDRLGFGLSDACDDKLQSDFIEQEAEHDFAAVRQQLGIEKFVLFGHSVGGGMAIHCAARFRDDCVAVITESAQAFVEDKTVQGIEAARELFKDLEQVSRLKKYHGEKTEWVLDAWISTWLGPDFASWSLQPVLPQLTCPILAIHGKDDEYGSTLHPQMIGQFAGGTAEIAIMADTRHVPHREQEKIVVGMVSRFVQSLD